MIRTCNNCAGRLVYDIKRKGLHCSACDSVFSVKDISVNYNDIAGGEEETGKKEDGEVPSEIIIFSNLSNNGNLLYLSFIK